MDDELQRQAERRIRERAAADAQAEAQARAQAEARARAQAEAERAAAERQRQTYRPPEVDNEPESSGGGASSAASAAAASRATAAQGIDLNQTQLIGIVGAGNASRGLVRLRNGDIVTVRVGDRINNGTITAIGTEGVTYNRSGQLFRLPILQGQ